MRQISVAAKNLKLKAKYQSRTVSSLRNSLAFKKFRELTKHEHHMHIQQAAVRHHSGHSAKQRDAAGMWRAIVSALKYLDPISSDPSRCLFFKQC